jgi:RND superfamily putative drug exporter
MTPLHPAVQYIVALLGLGLSIDYSLLIVNRWREERAAGKSNADAVQAAMRTRNPRRRPRPRL